MESNISEEMMSDDVQWLMDEVSENEHNDPETKYFIAQTLNKYFVLGKMAGVNK